MSAPTDAPDDVVERGALPPRPAPSGDAELDALRLDSASLRAMLGAKSELAAKLFEAQADLEDARGASAVAGALRRRASELRQ